MRSAQLAGKAQVVVRDAGQLCHSVATKIYEWPRLTEVSVQLLAPASRLNLAGGYPSLSCLRRLVGGP